MTGVSLILYLFFTTVFGLILPAAFFGWMIKKGWIKPSGSFTKYFCERCSGDILYAGTLRGRHYLSFAARKKPLQISVEVVLTSGSLWIEFQDKADGTAVYTWKNGDPLRFEISVQKGQTLLFHNKASCFTGSVCFRPLKRQLPVA